jgi:hypothetical protein
MTAALALACLDLAAAAEPSAVTAPDDPWVAVAVRSEVQIERPASQVWPMLLDLKAWKQGIGALAHVAGAVGEEDELRFLVPPDGNAANGYFLRTVRVVPLRHLVFELFPKDRAAFFGFAAFTLDEQQGRTTVTYDVYLDFRGAGLSEPQRSEFRRQRHDEMQAKFAAEHAKLKGLIERNDPQESIP